jgi:hypothetical protein
MKGNEAERMTFLSVRQFLYRFMGKDPTIYVNEDIGKFLKSSY